MKIKEVSKLYGISADTLRYYERVGLIRNVPRDKNGNRDYSEENCQSIVFIKCMRTANISIDSLVRYLDLYYQGSRETHAARKAILLDEKKRLERRVHAMNEALAYLNKKLETYDHWTI